MKKNDERTARRAVRNHKVRADGTQYVSSEALTARFASVEEPPLLDSSKIAEIRDGLNLSQTLFAAALNVSPETVRAWEQGKRSPDGAALRLLELAEHRPAWILESIRPAKASAHKASEDLHGDLSVRGKNDS
jgi:putative transcriptional regulator